MTSLLKVKLSHRRDNVHSEGERERSTEGLKERDVLK